MILHADGYAVFFFLKINNTLTGKNIPDRFCGFNTLFLRVQFFYFE